MNEIDKALLEKAMQWRIAMADNDCSESLKREFGQWLLAQPCHARAYDEAEHYWSGLAEIEMKHIDADLLKPTFYEHIYHTVTGFFSQVRDSIACQLTLGLSSVGAFCLVAFILFEIPGFSTENDVVKTHTYMSGIGEIKHLTLEDGSFVVLGADTSLMTMFSTSYRELRLIKGEAYFDVTKDMTRPFSVAAAKLKATATGTEFEVRKRKNKVEVSVSEGSVNVLFPFVTSNKNKQQSTTQSKHLVKGQRVYASSIDGTSMVESVNLKNIGVWRENRFVYFNAPLSDIIFDARRYYSAPIVVTNESINKLNISAIFDSSDVKGMFLTLSETFPMHVELRPDGTIILGSFN
jgi:transmembrane sensor